MGPPSPSAGCASATAISKRFEASISKSPRAKSSACSAPTAQAKPPRSKFSKASGSAPRARSGSRLRPRQTRKSRTASASACRPPICPTRSRCIEALELFGVASTAASLDARRSARTPAALRKARRLLFARCPADRSSALAIALGLINDPRCSFSTSRPPASIRRCGSKSTR